ncbi:hypothetical protein EV421DRAFT_1424693 [Armillaria borealis]|uniref:Uncharacterized protein n=1 Tax=Armillaria borealis TaxID=47425 RepID=A0AA39JZL9_9AGAR|nr:hypothetical protein EV421DRAFT_1424693 [Armillaria borealis]
MFQKGMGKEIDHPEGAQRRTRNSEREFSVKTNRHKQRREYLPSDIEDFIFTEGEDEDGSDEYIDSPTENDFSTDTEDSVELRQLRPRKRAPDNSPCDFKRMLSAESSLSSIATKISSGITEVHSDNDELSSVIEISSDSESEEDEHSKGLQSVPTQLVPYSKRRQLSSVNQCVSGPEGRRTDIVYQVAEPLITLTGSPSLPQRPPTKLRRLRRWVATSRLGSEGLPVRSIQA